MTTEEPRMASNTPILALDRVEAAYDDIIVALRGVSLEVGEGKVVALLGANGAGKSTTLKAISGLLRAEGGGVTAGSIRFRGVPAQTMAPRDLVRAGLVQVLEGRHCFPHFTVEENLITGALARRAGRRAVRADLEVIYEYFPRLRQVRRSLAGFTSGGEQQMVAIGRALMARPRLVLLDEPSMGLAPQITEEIFRIIRALNRDQGVSFLLAEQNARLALRHADHGYVLENGRVVASGTAAELAPRDDVRAFYLGGGGDSNGDGRDGRLSSLRQRQRHRLRQTDALASNQPTQPGCAIPTAQKEI
jgi:branched-chain amino acid transport system ATP-binding protein